jgi:hypothetical protein
MVAIGGKVINHTNYGWICPIQALSQNGGCLQQLTLIAERQFVAHRVRSSDPFLKICAISGRNSLKLATATPVILTIIPFAYGKSQIASDDERVATPPFASAAVLRIAAITKAHRFNTLRVLMMKKMRVDVRPKFTEYIREGIASQSIGVFLGKTGKSLSLAWVIR